MDHIEELKKLIREVYDGLVQGKNPEDRFMTIRLKQIALFTGWNESDYPAVASVLASAVILAFGCENKEAMFEEMRAYLFPELESNQALTGAREQVFSLATTAMEIFWTIDNPDDIGEA